jgi:hypothetical protein
MKGHFKEQSIVSGIGVIPASAACLAKTLPAVESERRGVRSPNLQAQKLCLVLLRNFYRAAQQPGANPAPPECGMYQDRFQFGEIFYRRQAHNSRSR